MTAVVFTLAGGAAHAGNTGPGGPEPRTAPSTIAEAEDAVDTAVADLDRAEMVLADLQAEQRDGDDEVGRLGERERELTQQLRAARRNARQLSVRAYVGGGAAPDAHFLFSSEAAVDLLWRKTVLNDVAGDTRDAAGRYRELREKADEDLVELVDRLDQVEVEIEQAQENISKAIDAEKVARAELEETKLLIRYGRAPVGDQGWLALRICESHNNYETDTGNGFYGAYQFDLQTWRAVGGKGNPALAPAWEQDARARALYAYRSWFPWPVCGRHLL